MAHQFKPPWQLPEWQERAQAWVEEALDAVGLRLTAAADPVHIRPWSTVWSIPTTGGKFFFKAGAPNQIYEPGLVAHLHSLQPALSLEPLAIERNQGWILLPDGGQTLRQYSAGKFSRASWEKLLARYAQLQIELAEHSEDLLSLGVPDHQPRELVELYPQVLADEELLLLSEALSEQELALLQAAQSQFADLCAELSETGLPASLDHGDLHDANVFVSNSDFLFFDWGDATVTHPFFSLMVPLRVIGNAVGIEEEDHPELTWARDAYLEPWQALAPMKALRRTWQLALPVGKFQRAVTWYNVLKAIDLQSTEDWHEAPARWLQEFWAALSKAK